jgi:hypothetical protein
MHMSRKIHLNALNQINKALKSEEASFDSTLVSALVMGLFDTIVFDQEKSVDSWAAHSYGTLSLLNFRGEKLLHTDLGKRVYIQVAHHIRTICAQRGTLLPPALIQLDKKMAPHIDLRMNPMIRYWPVLLHELIFMTKHPEKYTAMDIILVAVDHDAHHAFLMKDTSEVLALFGLSFDYPPCASFKKIAQKTMSINIIRLLNTIHQLRMLRCELIYWLISFLLNSVKDMSETATEAWLDFQKKLKDIVQVSVEGILGTLPFYLCPDSKNPNGPLKLASVSSLVWPLSTFAFCQLVPPEQRECARDAIRQIGERAKLSIALDIAKDFRKEATWYQMMHMFIFM